MDMGIQMTLTESKPPSLRYKPATAQLPALGEAKKNRLMKLVLTSSRFVLPMRANSE